MKGKCKACLIPAEVEGIKIASDGICNLCKEQSEHKYQAREEERKKREADLEKTLNDIRGRAEYDAVVCLSGGKDSIYLLHRLVNDYKLKVLAYTTDVNIPPLAWQSINKTVKKLNVDHQIYRPSGEFYNKLFRYLLRNQESRGAVYTVSYVYAPLFEGDALKLAIDKQIPLVCAGYSPGQPEPERMVYEFSRELIENCDWTPPHLKNCGEFTAEELSRFYNAKDYAGKKAELPRYIAPFHAWEYDQEKIMKTVVQLGLAPSKKHANPIFSNYPINWLLMYSDLKHFGYNPYAPEFSALIREGKASRSYWRIMAPFVNFLIRNKLWIASEIKRSLKELAMNENELAITLPQGAYDPPAIISPGSTTITRTSEGVNQI